MRPGAYPFYYVHTPEKPEPVIFLLRSSAEQKRKMIVYAGKARG